MRGWGEGWGVVRFLRSKTKHFCCPLGQNRQLSLSHSRNPSPPVWLTDQIFQLGICYSNLQGCLLSLLVPCSTICSTPPYLKSL